MDWITERRRDDLCDIIWWMKGYIEGAEKNYTKIPFNNDHVETLDQVARGMRKHLNEKQKEEKEAWDNLLFKANKFLQVTDGWNPEPHEISEFKAAIQRVEQTKSE